MANSAGNTVRDVFGGVLVLFGVLFLIDATVGVSFWALIWPFFMLVPGGALLWAAWRARGDASAMAIPGSIVTTVGAVLLVMVLTGRWEAWAYGWTLVAPTSVGIGLALFGRWSRRPGVYRIGQSLIWLGFGLFVVLALFFELLIWGDSDLGRFWPLLLVFLGILLLFGPLARTRMSR